MKTLTALLLTAGFGTALSAGTLFFGAYPDSVFAFDEATGKVVDRIKLETGLPVGLRLSEDRKTIYAITNDHSGIEVIDVATRKVIKKFVLNNETHHYRFYGGVPDPTGKLFYTITTEITRQIDHYDVGKAKYTIIDLNDGKILKTVELSPEDEAQGGGGYRAAGFDISPDGKFLYQFRDAVVILNTSDFKVVEKIELSKPEDPGMASIGFGPVLDSIGEPGYHVSIFNSTDPIVRNRVFGFARFDLSKRTVDYTPIGPAPDSMAGIHITPDKKRAYTIVTSGSHGNGRCEIWAFDLGTNRITQTQEAACRTRFSFGMSADGRKLYIYGAGFEFSVYDAATLKLEKTWNIGNDVTMAGLIVMP
jgi:DNA-binding beta-propeller fold protein YncE